MSEQPLFSFRNPWFGASVGVTAAVAVLAALAGLIWLPLIQPDLRISGIWDAICSAAGVPRTVPQSDTQQPDFKTSKVVLTSEMLTPGYSGVRPKIGGPKDPNADFRIDGPEAHGLAGLVNLFGIESPGLTSALSLAEEVVGMIADA